MIKKSVFEIRHNYVCVRIDDYDDDDNEDDNSNSDNDGDTG